MKTTKCSKCESEIKNCNLEKHIKKCDGNGPKKRLIGCLYCNKTWEELGVVRSEKGNHTRWCLLNPKYEKYKQDLKDRDTVSLMKQGRIKKFGQESWNKGETKETSKSIKQGGEKLSARYKSGELISVCKNKPLTKEHKEKVSKGMRKAHKENRHPGYSFVNKNPERMSYPEQFVKNLFENANLFQQFNIEIHKPVGRYFLDFAFNDLKVDFEVDSQYHIKDQKAIEHDNIRNNFLIENGWSVYRIFWKEFVKNPKRELQKFINYLDHKDKPKLVTHLKGDV